MKRFMRDNGLSLAFGILFLVVLALQSIAGWHDHNAQELAHHEDAISWAAYVTSSAFGVEVLENWQSEYLQFMLFMLATIWLVERGSPESKPPGEEGLESDQKQRIGGHADPESPDWAKPRGIKTFVYSNSLLIVMSIIFFGAWFAQSVTGVTTYNAQQVDHHQATVTWLGYLGSADFWKATLENWQSEFLAVGSFVALTVFLRQRGSTQSKPVGAPHHSTGVEG